MCYESRTSSRAIDNIHLCDRSESPMVPARAAIPSRLRQSKRRRRWLRFPSCRSWRRGGRVDASGSRPQGAWSGAASGTRCSGPSASSAPDATSPELAALSDRELCDIGLMRHDLRNATALRPTRTRRATWPPSGSSAGRTGHRTLRSPELCAVARAAGRDRLRQAVGSWPPAIAPPGYTSGFRARPACRCARSPSAAPSLAAAARGTARRSGSDRRRRCTPDRPGSARARAARPARRGRDEPCPGPEAVAQPVEPARETLVQSAKPGIAADGDLVGRSCGAAIEALRVGRVNQQKDRETEQATRHGGLRRMTDADVGVRASLRKRQTAAKASPAVHRDRAPSSARPGVTGSGGASVSIRVSRASSRQVSSST